MLTLEIKELKKKIPFEEPPRKRALKRKGTYEKDKPPIFTIVHRESKHTILLVLKNLRKKVEGIINRYVKNKATIYTDEYKIYNNMNNHEKVLSHYTVNHSKKEYANGDVHVNSDENRHSFLRKFLRIFRGVSKKNLQGYVLLEQYRINYKSDSYDMILQTIISNVP
ncbi:MAG: IS1595 family transposase [Methanobrevibacter sp.]|jgi:transposase-like protein|nr:IS1595 family transposase [Candidatus Methanovirga australis]